MRAIITAAKEVAPLLMHFNGETALSWRARLMIMRVKKSMAYFKLLILMANLFFFKLAPKLYL